MELCWIEITKERNLYNKNNSYISIYYMQIIKAEHVVFLSAVPYIFYYIIGFSFVVIVIAIQ